MAWADEVREAVGRALEVVGPAVVGVGRERRAGTGLAVAEGVAVAIGPWAPGDEVPVQAGGEAGTGTVLAVDGHLAALRIEGVPLGAPPRWADGTLGAGTPVIALAAAGGEGLRAGVGVVSGGARTPRGAAALEHSALLPRGGRGGPLLTTDGALVGINALRRPGGLILALAADADLRARVDALARGESAPPRPTLGVVLTPPPVARRLRAAVGLPERAGVLVRDVVPGSPAARAGLGAGDLVVAAGERAVDGPRALRDALRSAAGEPLGLTVVRGVEEREVAVALGES
jgi:serine protease Do